MSKHGPAEDFDPRAAEQLLPLVSQREVALRLAPESGSPLHPPRTQRSNRSQLVRLEGNGQQSGLSFGSTCRSHRHVHARRGPVRNTDASRGQRIRFNPTKGTRMSDRATPNFPSRSLVATSQFYSRLGFRERFRDEGWPIRERDPIHHCGSSQQPTDHVMFAFRLDNEASPKPLQTGPT
jgi:hypothetical protein